MLRFAEEIILLLLNDQDGSFANLPSWSLGYALAAGILMDLALENRIDTDPDSLVVLDPTPIGDSLLDPTLAEIAAAEKQSPRFWVQRTADRAEAIKDEALSRLVAKGILEHREGRFLWVFRTRRYPTVQGEAQREVKLRIMSVLFSDEIPHPRDVVIICLAYACRIFERLLSRQELANATPRIEQVRRLELIGREMSEAIRDIEASVAAAMQGHFHG